MLITEKEKQTAREGEREREREREKERETESESAGERARKIILELKQCKIETIRNVFQSPYIKSLLDNFGFKSEGFEIYLTITFDYWVAKYGRRNKKSVVEYLVSDLN